MKRFAAVLFLVINAGAAFGQQSGLIDYPRETGLKTVKFCKKFPAGYTPAIPGADEFDISRKDDDGSDYFGTLWEPYKNPDGSPRTKINWSQYSNAIAQICKEKGVTVKIDLPGKADDGSDILKSGPWSTTCKTDDAGVATCCSPRFAFTCGDGGPFEDQPNYDSVIKAARKNRGMDLQLELQSPISSMD